jgi:glycosyltransferase involved in cell wall biosynthesis
VLLISNVAVPMQVDVLMLLQNDWRTDSRVIREAEALVRAGYRVAVICRRSSDRVEHEQQNGVTYVCLPATSHRSAATYLSLLALWARLPALAVVGAVRRKRWSAALSTALSASVFYVLGTVAVAFFAPFAAIGLGLIIGPRVIANILRRPRPLSSNATHPEQDRASRSFVQRAAAWVVYKLKGPVASAQRVVTGAFQWFLQGPIYLLDFATVVLPHIREADARVVHAHDLVTLPAAFFATTSSGQCYVYDAHELETHTNYWSLNAGTRFWIAEYEKALIRQTDASITVCDSIADWLRDHYSIPRPVVVMNAPRLRAVMTTSLPLTRSLRNELDLPANDTPLMVYVGSVTVDRGLEISVQALAHMPEVHFALVGPRYEPLADRLKAIAVEEHVADRLHIMDPVPSERVVEYVRGADCSVVAIQNVCLSYYFCFPNKLLESVFAGVPVAVANLAELNRFIKRYPVGKVMDERSPASIAEAVTSIIQEKERFRPSTEQLRQIEAEYGWEAQEARLEALYRELLGGMRNVANVAG